MITTPNNFKSFINEIASKYSLNKKVKQKISAIIQENVNGNINDLNMVTYCSSLTNVKRAMIVHSKLDKVLPIEGARAVNESFDVSEMIELKDYGHYSILWSSELKDILNDELAGFILSKPILN